MYHELVGEYTSSESADELVAATNGFVRKAKLARWHRWGLIPAPVGRRFLGRGKGSATLYPPGTKVQLLRLCDLLKHDRRIAYAFWQLWRERYPIPVGRVRAFLDDIARKFDHGIRDLKHGNRLSEHAWKYLDRIGEARLSEPILRRTRKRVGKTRFPTIVRIVTEIATGTFRGWPPISDTGANDISDQQILEKGAGLERARTDQAGNVGPWLTGDIADELKALSKAFAASPLSKILADTSNEELVEARDELNTLLSLLNAAGTLGEGLLGRGAFGLGRIREFTDASPFGQGFFLLLWLILRRQQTLTEAYETLVRGSAGWLPHVDSVQALQQLRAQFPEVAKLLSYGRCRAALQDPGVMERLQAEIKAFSDANREALRAFFDRHPECRRQMTPSSPASADAPIST